MTLVVGYAYEGFGFLVADSLLTPTMETSFERGPVASQFHGLKIQIIHPHVAIAFASSNDVDAAMQVIRNLASSIAAQGVSGIPERLLADYLKIKKVGDPPADCEFLVLQLDNEAAHLSHITDQGARNCARAYIGDSVQYGELTKIRKPYVQSAMQYIQQPDGSFRVEAQTEDAGVSEFMELSDAMRDLSQKRRGSVGSIGDCVIRVCKALISGDLEYLQLHEASVSPWEGNSGYSLLASNSALKGIGVYYLSGKLGFIMIVGDEEHLRKEYADTKEAFVLLARTKYGLELE